MDKTLLYMEKHKSKHDGEVSLIIEVHLMLFSNRLITMKRKEIVN